jgi:tRNA threonylcarbamoyladenosine biosynthesis protein TsaE
LPILGTRPLHWPDESACEAEARRLALRPVLLDAVLALDGELGAGKTTFVRHLLRALGVRGRIKSPSYAVVEPHAVERDGRPLDIWHFDFYRFSDPREWEDAGLRELFARPGLKLCEWPQHAAGLMPEPDLRIEIDIVGEDARDARLLACTPKGLALIA